MFAPFITTDFLYCTTVFGLIFIALCLKRPVAPFLLSGMSPLPFPIGSKIVLPSVDTDGKSDQLCICGTNGI